VGEAVGDALGDALGDAEAEAVAEGEADADGELLGPPLGWPDGPALGEAEAALEELWEGASATGRPLDAGRAAKNRGGRVKVGTRSQKGARGSSE